MKPKLEVTLLSEVRDFFGVYELTVSINGKIYTYPITSEYAARKIEKMIRLKKFGKALHLLSQFKIEGFNSFEKKGEVINGGV